MSTVLLDIGRDLRQDPRWITLQSPLLDTGRQRLVPCPYIHMRLFLNDYLTAVATCILYMQPRSSSRQDSILGQRSCPLLMHSDPTSPICLQCEICCLADDVASTNRHQRNIPSGFNVTIASLKILSTIRTNSVGTGLLCFYPGIADHALTAGTTRPDLNEALNARYRVVYPKTTSSEIQVRKKPMQVPLVTRLKKPQETNQVNTHYTDDLFISCQRTMHSRPPDRTFLTAFCNVSVRYPIS
ncbi:hypothetical protein BJ138DRAFT_894529 [Hygrophoropsis aurantiaca]|uniref:Uncharacterized protein n=1 Tax=Hygrophoropsis aurantiaca TaxID=72124 RepID=A0ACB7ZTU8_9AGAM|nr:hypothetical protein BJ138DRAFT_894529 [Hygrophoropsis aurantiaca]